MELYIILECIDDMGMFPRSLPEEEQYVAVHFSNDSENFMKDIVNAFEEYYNCRIFYKDCSDMLIISSEEIIMPYGDKNQTK